MFLDPKKPGHAEEILRELNIYLNREFASYQEQTTTHHSVQFSIDVRGIKVEIDLLIGPYWKDTHAFFTYLNRLKLQHEHDWRKFRTL